MRSGTDKPDNLESEEFSFFDEEVSLVDEEEGTFFWGKEGLAGKIIAIRRGDAPVPCYGGLLYITPEGDIILSEKSDRCTR